MERYDEVIQEAEIQEARQQIEAVQAKDQIQRRAHALMNARSALAEFQEVWPKSDMDGEDKFLTIQEFLVDDMDLESIDDMLHVLPTLILRARQLQRRRMDALDSLFEMAMHTRARR